MPSKDTGDEPEQDQRPKSRWDWIKGLGKFVIAVVRITNDVYRFVSTGWDQIM